jgi:hypothetical protein
MSSFSSLDRFRGTGRDRCLRFFPLPRRPEAVGLSSLFIVVFLADSNGLGVLLADAHAHAAFGRRDRQLAIAELTDQVEGLLRLLLPRQAQRVVADVALDRLAHRRRSLKVAVGGHQPRKRLVRAVEIVVVDEVAEPPLAVRIVGEDRA